LITNQYLLGLKISNINVSSLHNYFDVSIAQNIKIRVGNLNINAANIGYENKWYKDYVNTCDIVFCDGKGIQLGLFFCNKKIPPQITYHTWIWNLAKHCNKNGYKLFLLGSKEGIAEKAMYKLLTKYPSLKVQCYHGYFDKSSKDNNRVIQKINDFNSHILIVGFGMPLQERWIMDNIDKINANIFLNGGAYLDWLSGIKKQAPRWVTKYGLEWFYRLIKEPKRLFKRYVIGNPKFLIRVIKEQLGYGKSYG